MDGDGNDVSQSEPTSPPMTAEEGYYAAEARLRAKSERLQASGGDAVRSARRWRRSRAAGCVREAHPMRRLNTTVNMPPLSRRRRSERLTMSTRAELPFDRRARSDSGAARTDQL